MHAYRDVGFNFPVNMQILIMHLYYILLLNYTLNSKHKYSINILQFENQKRQKAFRFIYFLKKINYKARNNIQQTKNRIIILFIFKRSIISSISIIYTAGSAPLSPYPRLPSILCFIWHKRHYTSMIYFRSKQSKQYWM